MKVKTIVELKFHHAYTGWNSLEITDSEENQVCVKMTDEDYLSLSDLFVSKCERIEKERAEEAAEKQRALEAKENEDG